MILFLDDWDKYPNAKPHLTTKNTSWLRIAMVYKTMGVKNHTFMLALHNPLLENVDPFSSNLDINTITMIVKECKENPWYFFREIARAPATGSADPVYLEANRGNIALWWLFFNHITLLLIQCRQTGKSLCSDWLSTYIKDIGAVNTDMQLLTKDDTLRVKNIARLKEIYTYLPRYLQLQDRSDANNTLKMTCNKLGNTYYTAVGQPTLEGARKVGRGLTLAINHVDEIAFIPNIHIILAGMLAGSGAARENSRKYGGLYGNIFTTTAGYLNSTSGKYVYDKIYKRCVRWTEKFLDCKGSQDLEELISKNSPRGEIQVLCEFNHRQLGKTDSWLRERMLAAMTEGEDAEADFLNIWSRGNESSPIPQDILERINQSRVGDPYVSISKTGYITNWYVSEDEVENKLAGRKLVIGMDTSEAIGKDDICKVILDAYTGEVVATGVYNETNIITFSEWLADFLIEYPNTTLIIEKRSTGITIVDNLVLILLAKNVDPFKRIFNWCVNDSHENNEYMENIIRRDHLLRSRECYVKYRKLFGYATSGVGRTSRDNLYGSSFRAATKYLCDVIRDRTLVGQLNSLVYKNGRIDHGDGEHDDLVISFLIAFWFLTNAKNMSFYGIEPRHVLSTINRTVTLEQGGPEVVKEKQRQAEVKTKIEKLVEELKQTKVPYQAYILYTKIKHLYEDLGDYKDNTFSLEHLLEDIKILKNTKTW